MEKTKKTTRQQTFETEVLNLRKCTIYIKDAEKIELNESTQHAK